MPVVELLLLRLRPGISATDPTVVENLSTVRALVHTNSRFYHCIEEPGLIYILGQWPSLTVHKAFLASAERDQILSHQTHQLDFCWMLHLELPDGETMVDALPFTAPVLSIARIIFHTSGPQVDAYKRILANHRSGIVDATRPHALFDGWRIDARDGGAEHVILTGWQSVEAHAQFTKATSETTQACTSVRDHVQVVEVRHATNMEAS